MGNKANWEGVRITDESTVEADGGFVGNLDGKWLAPTFSTYTADGAISAVDDVAALDSDSATTQMTLGIPASGAGSRIIIHADSYTNTMDVDATFADGSSTATFSENGESIELVWSGSDWIVISNNGAVLS